ncbi:hypothetical protein GCK72_003054 [Caenorhabditis remanei]|nr:hypothetical protein GCK72_003054 [Caenorhabditis remanei]KAF1771228.1 hypothetical protein GCK72_003054 [Caenorhabditis remanei]
MKLFAILVFAVSSTLVACDAEEDSRLANTDDLVPMTAEPRDAARDAADLELGKATAKKFAEDIMNVRKSEDIHDLTNWLLDSVVFNVCGNRLYKNHFTAFITNALLDEEQNPGQLTFDADDAYTREDNLSISIIANNFIFEKDDKLILDFKKQEDGSWKLSYGTILTCKPVVYE